MVFFKNIKKIALCTTALLAFASSCFALNSGYYYRLENDKLYTVTVLSRDGHIKNSNKPVHYEFVELRNSFDEVYSSVMIKTGPKTSATTSGFVTDKDSEQGRYVSGYLKGQKVGYDRMGTREGDFTLEDLGNGKIKVSSNVGLVKGFGLDGVYQKEETFLGASSGLALHALEVIGKETGYLAIDDINYEYRVVNKEDASWYVIQAWQNGALAGVFEVRVDLGIINFIWNNQPIELFKHKY